MRTIFTGLAPRLLCSLFCAACALWPSVLCSQTPTNCAAPPAGLVSWWRADNNASDTIGGNAGVLQPGATFAAGEVGTAFSFNGNTNSYIEVPDSPALRLTNEVTIEFWVKRQRLTFPSYPYADYIVEKGGDFTGGQDNYSAALHNSTYNYCLHFVFAGGWRGGGSIADTNYWHHCAIVARNGDADPTLYVDGVMQPVVYREGASTINLYPSTRPLHIGAQLDPATGWFYFSDTLVDELAIYGRALSAAEIQSIYAAGSLGKCVPPVCAPAPSGLVGWWRAEGDASDAAGTNSGVPGAGVSFAAGEVAQAFRFNGETNSYVEVPDSPALRLTNEVTIEFWVKRQRLTFPSYPYADYIVEKGGDFTGGQDNYSAALHNSTYNYCLHFVFAGGWRGGGSIADTNYWHHCAIVARNGDADPTLYVDGVMQPVVYREGASTINLYPSTRPLHIGAQLDPATGWFYFSDTLVDELSIYNRALGSNEVQAIYNAGAAGKCTATQAPTIVSQPQDQVVNAGQDAIFTVQAQGSAPFAYQWFFGSTPLNSPAGAMLVVSNAQPAQAGNYHVVVSNSVGFAVSSNALLTVLTNPPAIILQPSDQTVAAGDTAMLSVTAEGTPPLSYQWFLGSSPVPGGTDTFLMLYSVQPTQAGYYSVVVSNPYGSVTSSNALLTVLTYPPAITSQPRGTNAYVGSTVTFQVVASGSPVLAYQWQKDGAPLPGATGSIYRIFNAQLTNAGTYSVIVTNPYGALPSSNAVLTVRVPPPCTPPPPGLVSWWRGENNLLDGWDANNGNLSPGTLAQVRYAAGKVGQCFSFGSFLVPDSPSLHVSNITLQAWVNAPSYAGSLSHTIVSKVDYPRTGVAAAQSSFYLGTTNNGLVYFAVSPNGSNTVSVTTTVPLAPNDWSFVVATYDGSVLQLYINGMLAATKPYSGGIFQGNDNLGIGAIPYPYSNSATYAPFNGLLDEICIYNRALSDSEVLALYNSDVSGMCLQPPTITRQPDSQEIPLGEDVLFSASVVGSRPLSYQWYFNTQPLARATNAYLLLEKVRTNQAGPYFVRVTNSLGSATSAPATLKLLPAPVCTPAPAGLVSWWPADNSPIDVVGTNNAILSTLYFPPYTTGKVGQCFNLNNQRSPYLNRVSVPSSPALDFGTNSDLSIEAWVKYLPNSLTPGYPYPPYPPYLQPPSDTLELVSKYGAQASPIVPQSGYSLSLSQGRLAFWLGWSVLRVTNSAIFISSGPDLRDTMFHHVAVTLSRNRTNGGKLYVDGQDVLTFDTTGFKGGVANSAPLLIGSDGAFSGLIDELTFYSRALSADEVLAIRQAGAAGKCKVRPFIITQPANQTAPLGSNATFTVTVDGTPNLRYQWRFNGAPLFGATSSSLTITNVQSARLGKYSVTITNGFGLVLSTNAMLAFNGPPVAVCATAVVSAGPNCMAAASIDNGSADADGDPVTLTQTPPGPYPLGTNVVTLTATDKWGATNSCTALVIVLDRTPPAIICPADIVVTNAHNALTSVVTFSPAVSDNCSSVGVPVCNPASGSAFGVGPHTVTCSVTDAAGNSNQCAFKVTVLPGNVPPVPIIRVSPLAEFPGVTNLLVIAGNGTNATVVFDGSKSYDLDDTNFNYYWYEGTNLFSTGVVATRMLALGLHSITLKLDDTFPSGVSSASVTVQVISAEQAVELLIGVIKDSSLPNRVQQPLLQSLDQAEKQLDRGDLRPAREVLVAFEHKVRELVARLDLPLAKELQTAAQQIVDALDRVGRHGGPKGPPPTVTHQSDGKLRLRFAGESGRVQIIEASSDLVHWQKVGVATEVGNGWFEFEDAKAAALPYRYYRVVSP